MHTQKVPLKHRIIHSVCYEVLLLLIGTPLLSIFFKQSLGHVTVLWIIMSLISVVWNMIFNILFEKLERKLQWQKRTIKVRILHAIGFEGSLIVLTMPIIAYMLDITLWQALLLDIGMVLLIVVYTFIFQWIYDIIMKKYVYHQD